MSLAPVEIIHSSNSRDVPATLRLIADQIESGEHGEVKSATLVVEGTMIDVCHLGAGTSTHAHLMLCLAQRKLEGIIMRQIGEE